MDLPEPDTPVTQQKTPSGNSTSIFFRLCCAAPRISIAPLRPAPLGRHGDLALAAQVLAGERLRDPLDPRRRALGDHAPAVLAGAGTEVDDVVGGAHRALVVLDDDHGVAEVAQPREHVEQLVVVALVQPDRGLVEDVEHARRGSTRSASRAGSAAPRRPDSVAAARSSVRYPTPDAVEELQPLADLLQDPGRDLLLRRRLSSSVVEPLDRLARRLARELVDAEAADLDGQDLRPQPRAVALRARAHRHVLLDALARLLGVGLAVAALEARHDALERRHVRAPAPHPVAVGDVDALALVAVEEEVLVLLRQVLPRHVEVDRRTSRRSPARAARSSRRPSSRAGSRPR